MTESSWLANRSAFIPYSWCTTENIAALGCGSRLIYLVLYLPRDHACTHCGTLTSIILFSVHLNVIGKCCQQGSITNDGYMLSMHTCFSVKSQKSRRSPGVGE